MDRRHLRHHDRILLLHLLGEYLPFVRLVRRRRFDAVLLPLHDRSPQGPDTDPGRAQVGSFIDLQDRVQLIVVMADLLHLVSGDRVETAAEGVQLDQFHIVAGTGEYSRAVHTGVIDPLVENTDRPLQSRQMADGILRQDHHAIGVDQLVHAVVDLRIHMVRTSRQDDRLHVMILSVLQRILTSLLHILVELPVLRPGRLDGRTDLGDGDPHRLQDLLQFFLEPLVVVVRQERMEEPDALLLDDLVHVVGDDLRISRDDRAVIMVRLFFVLDPLVVDARIEDQLVTVPDQRLDVTVDQFGRIAGRIRRDRIHTHLVDGLLRHR